MGTRPTVTSPSAASVEVAAHIAEAMRRQGVTQSALAELTGVSQPQWSQILAGRKEMTVGQMLRACDALGIDPKTVLG